jgi:hypothetical protein
MIDGLQHVFEEWSIVRSASLAKGDTLKKETITVLDLWN